MPDKEAFPLAEAAAYEPTAQPGAVVAVKGTVRLNEGRKRVRLAVTSRGDRPIQVGSHYHFVETNPQLEFDRARAYGSRLDIAAGTSVRFEPGDTKTVTLVEIGGNRVIRGGNNLASGGVELWRADEIVAKLRQAGFAHAPEPAGDLGHVDAFEMARSAYATMFGPTTGDLVRLGATDLWIKVEKDFTVYGDECKFGGGKTLREGMGQATGRPDAESLDMVVTNALVVDWSGIYKADIGVKDGLIVGIGKAGNPDVMDGVTPRHGGGQLHRRRRRRGQDHHRRRHRHPHPLHLPAAGLRGHRVRHHHHARRRNRTEVSEGHSCLPPPASSPLTPPTPPGSLLLFSDVCVRVRFARPPGGPADRRDAARERAPRRARRARTTCGRCCRRATSCRSTWASRARATTARPRRCASRSRRGRAGSSCTRTGARRRRPSTRA